jgi:hypothetical protein
MSNEIKQLAKSGKSLSIAPNPNVDNQYVVRIMDLAFKYKVPTALVEPDY